MQLPKVALVQIPVVETLRDFDQVVDLKNFSQDLFRVFLGMATFVATDDGFFGRFSGRIAAFPAPEVERVIPELPPSCEVVGVLPSIVSHEELVLNFILDHNSEAFIQPLLVPHVVKLPRPLFNHVLRTLLII